MKPFIVTNEQARIELGWKGEPLRISHYRALRHACGYKRERIVDLNRLREVFTEETLRQYREIEHKPRARATCPACGRVTAIYQGALQFHYGKERKRCGGVGTAALAESAAALPLLNPAPL